MFVYMIRPEDASGHIKIGISSTPLDRIAQLQTGHPRRLRFMRVFHCQSTMQAREIESSLHVELDAGRPQGGSEWIPGHKYKQAVKQFKKGRRQSRYSVEMPVLWNFLAFAKNGTHEEIADYLREVAS